MKKIQKISWTGVLFFCFGVLISFSLFLFLIKKNNKSLGYFFFAKASKSPIQSVGFFTAMIYCCGELIVGLMGFIPAFFLAIACIWQGYRLIIQQFFYYEFLLSLNIFLLLIPYCTAVILPRDSAGLFGIWLQQLLTRFACQKTTFFVVTFLLVAHLVMITQFKGIFFVKALCRLCRPYIMRLKIIFVFWLPRYLSLVYNCFRMLTQIVNYLFQKTVPPRLVRSEKKMFAQACQELIDFRIRYFNTALLCESLDADRLTVVPKEELMPPLPQSLQVENLFDDTVVSVDAEHTKQIKNTALLLEEKLKRCGILGYVVGIKEGPVVTLFEYKPEGDTKLTKILNLEDDLVMALEALSIRIRAPIPGTALVGFEIPNKKRQILRFGSIMTSDHYRNNKHALPLVLGHDAQGEPAIYDLALMPHILMAGSTGSGKSVTLHGFIIGLLQHCSFQTLKFILIDPKRLELSYYQDIPHLLFPVVYEVSRAVTVLQWVVEEMNRRYELIAQLRVRSLGEYNSVVGKEQALPFIVVVIDELADLMMTGGRDIEDKIVRLAQMARASGIHLIVATQRPSVDVVTGLIKVNFTSRIALRVISKIDSRTIIDTAGAHKLLGKGDMLFLDGTSGQLNRIHAALLTTVEIERVVVALKKLAQPNYLNFVDSVVCNDLLLPEDGLLYAEVKKFLNEVDEVSISLLQRKFRIGYNRAARIIEAVEAEGIILPSNGSKVRKIIR